MSIDTDRPDILPNTLARDPKSAKQDRSGLWWVPIHCANCGVRYGIVPQDLVTDAFALCNSCFEKHGAPAGLLCMSDEVVWEKIRLEMIEQFGRQLSNDELEAVMAADCTPLATLLKQAAKGA